MGRWQHFSVYPGKEEADLAMRSCKINPMIQSPSKYLLALLASSTRVVDLQHVQVGWAGSTIPRADSTKQDGIVAGTLLWAAGGLGLLLLLCQHVPCPSCFSVTCPGTGWWHFGDKPPGKREGEDVKEKILWALKFLVSHATVLTFLKGAPPQPWSWFPTLVTDLCSGLSCILRKKSVKSGNGQLHTWASAVH